MTTPTNEQIAAAKAYVRDEETDEHLLTLRKYDLTENTTVNAARILLAALEAAERTCAKRTSALTDYFNAGEWTKELDAIGVAALTYDGSLEGGGINEAARKEPQP